MSGFQTLIQNPEYIPFILLVLLFASSLHEFAHAIAAFAFGDPTPKEQGRLSLNPRKHLDPIGMIMFLLLGFGWAKPIETDPRNFKYPRTMSVLVSLAGPLGNLFLAFLSAVISIWYTFSDFPNHWSEGTNAAIGVFLTFLFHYNMIWFLLNLLPIPPFDGYKILKEFVPARIHYKLAGYEQFGIFIFFALIIVNPLYEHTLSYYFELETDFMFWFSNIIFPWFRM